MEWLHGDGCLTVGRLREAIRDLPDDAEVGFMMSHVNGHVNKVDAVRWHEAEKVLVVDDSSYLGCFTEDEVGTEDMVELCSPEP